MNVNGTVASTPGFNPGDFEMNQRAGALLLDALADPVTERDALVSLQLSGEAGVQWIERALAPQQVGNNRQTSPEIVTELRALLASRGDVHAIEALQQPNATDPVSVASRLAVLDPNDHQQALVAGLQHAAERVRQVALRQLQRTELTPALAIEIRELARHDPRTTVRATAIETLVASGLVEVDWLESRLADPDPWVRAIVMRALSRLDCPRAEVTLAGRLSATPSGDGLAAARALVACSDRATAAALDLVRRALKSSDVALRSEAATTADVFAWLRVPDWVSSALASDPVPAVRLALAIALERTQKTVAHAALRELSRGDDPMVSLQAAVVLAERGDADALAKVHAATQQPQTAVRRAAFLALGRLSTNATVLLPGLSDADARVRLAAASAVLRATL